MGYIKNQEHFRNYIQKVVRESAHILEEDSLMPVGQYVHEAFEHADEFTWKMKEDVTVLHENNFWEWLRFKKVAGFSMPPEVDQITTQVFNDTIDDLAGSPGIYSFWNKAGMCLYVGVSCDIAGRIVTSFTERFKHYSDAVFLRYITTKSASDAAVLEVLFIVKLKPVLNKTSKFDDEFTLDFKEPPLSKPIPCNKEGQKVSVRLAHNRYETRLDIEEFDSEGLEKQDSADVRKTGDDP